VQGSQGVVEHVAHRGAGCERRLLREVAELRGPRHRAGVGGLDAGKQPQEGRLAGAVLAHHPKGQTGGSDDVDAVEHDAVAVGLGEVARDERLRAQECGFRHR
jgi:hypothetical protein